MLKIWDITSQESVATFEGFKEGINSLSFSENGYYLASSSVKENTVKIWDLRKPKIFKSFEVSGEIRKVKFDFSGNYLGIVGDDVKIYNMKQWELFAEFSDHTDIVTDIDFASNCRYFATSSMDRNLKIFQ